MAFGDFFPFLYKMNEFSFVHIVVRNHVYLYIHCARFYIQKRPSGVVGVRGQKENLLY